MAKALRGVGKLFMAMCTVLVVLSGLIYVVGKAIGIPVRVTYQTVATSTRPEHQQPAPALPQRRAPAPDSSASPLPAGPPAFPGGSAPPVQNVVFFVGDGMGLSMLSTVDALAERGLAMSRMPVAGFVRTASLSDLITDSAAGATAFATGYKTANGSVAMTPDGIRRTTILEAAAAQGFATGVVTTSYLTDATPAAFTTHAPDRDLYGRIARQMVASEADVLVGGAQPEVFSDSLRRAARAQGFVVSDSLGGLTAAPGGRWLGLFPERDGRFAKMHGPPLSEVTAAAIRKLRRHGERFFLVVEQEGTDAAGHTNRLQDARRYLTELDRAVETALRLTTQPDSTDTSGGGGTLVLVTADHDTGGLNITGTNPGGRRVTARWNNFGHTAQWTPLLAYGPGAGRFTGILENTAHPERRARLLRLAGFPKADARAAALRRLQRRLQPSNE
jgi:alkaline phosphatase